MEIVDNIKNDLIAEVEILYNKLLDETIELMKQYNCNTPLEIYCLFNLISNYYVDSDEIFDELYLNKRFYSYFTENSKIQGVQTILNGGVCRHKSAMLKDIYRKMNINSVVLQGYSETLLNFSYTRSLNKQLADRKFVNDMLIKISKGAKITDFKKNLKERKIFYQMKNVHDDYYLNNKRLPNHAIVLAGNDMRYYLDPMNEVTYFQDEKDIITLKNSIGLYFFSLDKINHLLWKNSSDYNYELESYNKIMKNSCSKEKDNNKEIKEIYSYLKKYQSAIEKFVKDKEESINDIRQKCLMH